MCHLHYFSKLNRIQQENFNFPFNCFNEFKDIDIPKLINKLKKIKKCTTYHLSEFLAL